MPLLTPRQIKPRGTLASSFTTGNGHKNYALAGYHGYLLAEGDTPNVLLIQALPHHTSLEASLAHFVNSLLPAVI